MKTLKELKESYGSIIKDFMKKKKEDVKYSATWHVRPQGRTIDRPDTSKEPKKLEESKIKAGDSDQLKLMKLQTMALKAFPSSPRQIELNKQIAALREKMKKEGTPEYHQVRDQILAQNRKKDKLEEAEQLDELTDRLEEYHIGNQGFRDPSEPPPGVPKDNLPKTKKDKQGNTLYKIYHPHTKKAVYVTIPEKEKLEEAIKVKVSHKGKIGYRIADIGPGGKEHNVKEVDMPKKDLKEGVTGPTRMQLQDYFNKTTGSLRARIYRTEQAFGVYDIRLNSHNEIIYFKENPIHHAAIDPSYTGHQVAYAFHEEKKSVVQKVMEAFDKKKKEKKDDLSGKKEKVSVNPVMTPVNQIDSHGAGVIPPK